MRTFMLLALLALAGCAFVNPVTLKDPKTGQIKECTSNLGGGFFPIENDMIAQHEIDACAASYERMGWIRQ